MASKKTKQGGKRGRKPDASSTSGKIRELLKTDKTASEIAKKLGCTPALVYNVKARMTGGPKRRPKATRTTTRGKAGSTDGLASILSAVQNSEKERVQLRSTLERIQSVIQDALA